MRKYHEYQIQVFIFAYSKVIGVDPFGGYNDVTILAILIYILEKVNFIGCDMQKYQEYQVSSFNI